MATFGDLEMIIGDSGQWTGTVTNDAGVAQSLSGLTVTFTMNGLVVNLTQPGGTGVVVLGPLARANTSAMTAGIYPYSIVLVDGSSQHVTAEIGKFNLIASPTP